MRSLNSEDIQTIIKRLNIYIGEDKKKRTNKFIGNSIGYSPSAISLFKRNKYPTDPLPIAIKIEKFLELEENSVSSIGSEPVFCRTSVSTEILRAIRLAEAANKSVAIVGEPGSGKTITLVEYKDNINKSAIFIEMDETITKRALINKLCRALKIKVDDGTQNDRYDRIIDTLRHTKRVIIIDEGEYCTTQVLEIARRIHDKAKSPMILSGTFELELRLKGRRSQQQQLSSRIGMIVRCDRITEEDAKMIVEANYPPAAEYYQYFYMLCKENARTLTNLMDLVRFAVLETGCEINDDLIDECSDYLLITDTN